MVQRGDAAKKQRKEGNCPGRNTLEWYKEHQSRRQKVRLLISSTDSLCDLE